MFKKLTDKQKLITLGIFILIVAVIFFLVYRAGKKKGGINISNPIIDNPDDTNNQGEQLSETEIQQLASDVYNDMDGLNLSHDSDIWNRVLAMSDTDFVRLNNAFNTKFQKDSDESFYSWVKNESSITALGFSWPDVQQILLKKFSKLNIK